MGKTMGCSTCLLCCIFALMDLSMSDSNKSDNSVQTIPKVLMNITVSDGTSDSNILSSKSSFLTPVIISSIVIMISLTVLIWASIITRRKQIKRKRNEKHFIDAIINRGESIQIKTEIENNLDEQRNLEILGQLPSLPSKIVLSPMDNDEARLPNLCSATISTPIHNKTSVWAINIAIN